jgi:hypothetical protein
MYSTIPFFYKKSREWGEGEKIENYELRIADTQ